jgi:colanic acid/amylovoran biosynthesis glycosyltransferase
MRIAIVTGHFPALSETFILNHVSALVQAGFEVTVIAHGARREACVHPEVVAQGLAERTRYLGRPDGYAKRVVQLPRQLLCRRALARLPHWPSAVNPLRFGRMATGLDLLYSVTGDLPRNPRFDVIHAHFGDGGARAAFLRDRGLLQGPIVTTLHGAENTLGKRTLRYLARRGDVHLAVSEFWARQLVEEFGFPSLRTRVHRVGIDCARYAFEPRAPQPNQPLRLITVCRLAPRKGVQDALKALAKAQRQRASFRFSFTVVGGGPMEEELRGLAESLGVAGSVRFTGPVDQARVAEELARADIFLHPSYTTDTGEREGIPVSMMEAMARGLAVLSTRHAGIPELVTHGRSGYLVRERDVPALADALIQLWTHPELIAAWGTKGRARVEEAFNRAELDRRLISLYRQLVRSGQPEELATAPGGGVAMDEPAPLAASTG